MQDGFPSPAWADNHVQASTGIYKQLKALLYGFKRLQAHQFAAPWPSRHRSVRL